MPWEFDDPFLVIDHDRPQVGKACLRDDRRDPVVGCRRLQGDRRPHRGSEQTNLPDLGVPSGHEIVDHGRNVVLFIVPISAVLSLTQSMAPRVVQKDVQSLLVKQFCITDPPDFAVPDAVQIHHRAPRLVGLLYKP